MILIDCSELSADEKLSLASQISDKLEGTAIALIKGQSIVLDELSDKKPELSTIESLVAQFVSRRRDAEHYSFDVDGERIIVHSSDPIAAMRSKAQNQLPPNLMKCPYCAFVTPYEESYTVHVRAHLFGL